MLRKLLLLIISSVIVSQGFGQATLKGVVTDGQAGGEPLPTANVQIMLNGAIIQGTTTDWDGNYFFNNVPVGNYTVRYSYMGYETVEKAMTFNNGKVYIEDVEMGGGATTLIEIEIVDEKQIFEDDANANDRNFGIDDLNRLPSPDPAKALGTISGVGVNANGDKTSTRGSRSGDQVRIDGMTVYGAVPPKQALQGVQMIVGGHPAKYGDVTGGIINYTTRAPMPFMFGGGEAYTSNFGSSNNLAVTFSTPLLTDSVTTDQGVSYEKAILGMFLAGTFGFVPASTYSTWGYWRAKEDVVQDLIDKPYRETETVEPMLEADFLHADAFEKANWTRNRGSWNAALQSKFDYVVTEDIRIIFGVYGKYSRSKVGGQEMFNYFDEVKGTTEGANFRGFVKLQHELYSPKEEEGGSEENDGFADKLRSVRYNISFDYTTNYSWAYSPEHKDNLFAYNYVGKFTVNRQPYYSYKEDTVVGVSAWTLENYPVTHVEYDQSHPYGVYNPMLVNYNEYYYDLYYDELLSEWDGNLANREDDFYNRFGSFDLLAKGGGLLNGNGPMSVYGMYQSPGTYYTSYSKAQTNQFRGMIDFEVAWGDHQISFGYEYEQRSSSSYGVSPNNLWERGRALMNSHILELDFDNPYMVFDNGTYHMDHAYNGNIFMDTVIYGRKYNADAQYQFDVEFRRNNNLSIAGTDMVDIDEYRPEDLEIEFFSPEELINEGSSYVIASGYDYYGNKMSETPSFDDFLNETYTDAAGNVRYSRPVAPYEPIYMGTYLQDKFSINDMIFSLGLRVDMFDANQMVLKDPYLLYESYTVGELGESGADFSQTIPGNIDEDHVVYVDNYDNPSKIVGYRNGENWYDAKGSEISDPTTLYQAGKIQPFRKETDDVLRTSAFKDYEPEWIWQPRIAFSFTISEQAQFYAYYDILAQRPNAANVIDPIRYLYFQKATSLTVNNPDLKAEKTIDYELGFKNQFAKTQSGIVLSAFYREMRDMIQVKNMVGTDPGNYITYGNLDFGTVKGFSAEYILQRTGNVSLNANYTLQFANGTGSDVNTSLSLLSSGQPNLRTLIPLNYDQRHAIKLLVDYRFETGTDYKGPGDGDDDNYWEEILNGVGTSIIGRAGSGTPWTKREYGGQIVGSPNGARLPWFISFDVRVDKEIILRWKDEKDVADDEKALPLKDGKTTLIVYATISNILNTRNVTGVYNKTGDPEDDGFLSFPQNQSVIQSQHDVEAYTNYYLMHLYPGQYSAPRSFLFGVQFTF